MKVMQYIVRWLLLSGLLLVSGTATKAQDHLSEVVIKFKAETDSLIKKRAFSQAIDLAKPLMTSELDKESQIAFYLQMQKIYAPPNASNFDSIIYYIHQVLTVNPSDSLKTSQFFELGNLQVFTGQFPTANQNFLKAWSGIEHLPTSLDSIRLFSRLALTSEDPEDKVKWLEKLNTLALQSDDAKAQTIAYFDQLNYYLRKGDTEKSADLLTRLKSVSHRLQDSVIISNVYKMVAHSYRSDDLMNLDSAKHYLIKAINHLSSRMIADEKDILQLQLATNYFYQKEYQKAIEIGTKAIENLEKAGRSTSGEVRQGYSSLGYSAEELGQLDEAEKYFQKELELTRLQEEDYFIERALSSLIRVKKTQGETANIYLLYDEMLAIKDTLNTQYNEELVTEAETRLGLTLKEQELENQNLRLAQQQRQQTWFLIVIGLLILVLTAAIWAYRRIQQSKDLISKQKALVEQSLTEKEFLLKEIHHRVKNNLQIISSLLDKQARNSADQILKSKMQEGKDRIQSMALIHQNLYQSENLSSIDIRKYIQELAQHIAFTQQASDQNIKIDIQADELQLNIDQAIPVGLILNELLTNAFKHAFQNRHKGLVNIKFTQKNTSQFELHFSDNGKGMNPDFNLKQSKTLGMSLINGLVQQLEGNFQYESSTQGTHFYIQFSA